MNSRPLISRPRYLHILHAALSVRQPRFARLAALDWLAAYPGDLAVGLCYARALVGENRPAQAAGVLDGLRRADPEYAEAVETLAGLEAEHPDLPRTTAATSRFALTGHSRDRRTLATWGGSLWLGRQALAQGKLDLAEEMVRDALRQAPDEPLVQIVHLNLLRRAGRLDPAAGREMALRYHDHAPDCLTILLHLALWSLEAGAEDAAVALLHQVAARDVGGQTTIRLWGENHPYRVLWPERMQLDLRLSLPAEVSAALGWNRLPDTTGGAAIFPVPEPAPATPVASPRAAPLPASVTPPAAPATAAADPEATRPTAVRRPAPSSAAPTGELYWALATADARIAGKNGASAPEISSGASAAAAKSRLAALVGSERPAPPPPLRRKGLDPELAVVSKELDRLARRLQLPVHGPLDGRFPVYVILSLHRRLEAWAGAGAAALLEAEMEALAETVGRRRGWAALRLLADDPAALTPLGLTPVRSGDPWELKLLLADLDAALARRGQCIGALLIVGGPEIVPFHCLPNPVDDQDADVPSDNPYATTNENYFVPEWPVGRLPGGERDGRLLLDCLRRIRQAHAAADRQPSWLERLLDWLRGLGSLRRPAAGRRRPRRHGPAFGYTAAVWKDAAAQVFRPIGRAAALHVSPPRGFDGGDPATAAAPEDCVPRPLGRLGYFNLHGLADGSEWFGQRDPLDPQAAPDFPVALRPEDILCAAENPEQVPLVVFSQACYGLPSRECAPHQSVALSFLQAGSLAVVGSTGMSYGALSAHLAAGDLLAQAFWRGLQRGLPAGEALRQAKLQLAAEVSAGQGYLDGEEQKTLISFALFGDPLAAADPQTRLPKSLRYLDSPLAAVHTVCDRAIAAEGDTALAPDALQAVRRAVARYLPGMADARLLVTQPRSTCDGAGHDCPTSQLERRSRLERAAELAQPGTAAEHTHRPLPGSKGGAAGAAPAPTGRLVTLSKPVHLPGGTHPRIARLTLDASGKLVKLVVSR